MTKFWSIKSATLVIWSAICLGASGLNWNQFGWLIGMSWPLPTFQTPCLRMGVGGSIIVLQIQEECFLGLCIWRSSLGQFFSLRVLVKRRLGLLQILQYCLANKALFMRPNVLSPNPPSFFGLVIVSQFVIWIFLWPGSCPHGPPKSIDNRIQLLANNIWSFKNREVVDWHWMENRVNQGQSTSLG